ncbi:MAG: two-component system LytT family response regulator [Planctomycetota bacterium]|jgi:two-component system LytT family response regulator
MKNEPELLRVVLADDEPMARLSVKSLLSKDEGVQLVAECANGMQAVEAVREHKPDILFLDIQMPGMGGFEVLETLDEEELPTVVFATAFDRYAVEAFDASAVDYLLKPFDDERFFRALERAKDQVGKRKESAEQVGELLAKYGQTISDEQEASNGPLMRITIPREGRIDVVETAELFWIEAADQYVDLHTKNGVFLMRESMAKLERCLDPTRFQRIHRSVIVALDAVRALERQPGGTGRVQVADDKWLPVSRSRYTALKARIV